MRRERERERGKRKGAQLGEREREREREREKRKESHFFCFHLPLSLSLSLSPRLRPLSLFSSYFSPVVPASLPLYPTFSASETGVTPLCVCVSALASLFFFFFVGKERKEKREKKKGDREREHSSSERLAPPFFSFLWLFSNGCRKTRKLYYYLKRSAQSVQVPPSARIFTICK